MARGAAAALDGEAGGLVEGDQPLVLIDDQAADEGSVLGLELTRDRLGRRCGQVTQGRDAHLLAGFHTLAGLDPLAVEPELAGAAQLLHLAKGECREMRLDPAIEAPARLFLAHLNVIDLIHAASP